MAKEKTSPSSLGNLDVASDSLADPSEVTGSIPITGKDLDSAEEFWERYATVEYQGLIGATSKGSPDSLPNANVGPSRNSAM